MKLLDVADMISAVRSIFRTNMRYFQMARSAAAKAMPVIFTTVEQFEIWLSGDVEEALKLQRPLPPEHLKIVAKGERIQGTQCLIAR